MFAINFEHKIEIKFWLIIISAAWITITTTTKKRAVEC